MLYTFISSLSLFITTGTEVRTSLSLSSRLVLMYEHKKNFFSSSSIHNERQKKVKKEKVQERKSVLRHAIFELSFNTYMCANERAQFSLN